MKRLLSLSLVALLSCTALTGCSFYVGGDDDDDDMWMDDYPDPDNVDIPDCEIEVVETDVLRNPQTGECEAFEDGLNVPCPIPGGTPPELPPNTFPSWGSCESECTDLDELGCLSAAGCRGIYVDPCPAGDCSNPAPFRECWPIDDEGPAQDDNCLGLDSTVCSEHNNCVAIHSGICSSGFFPDDPDCLGGFGWCQFQPTVNQPSCGSLAEAECVARSDCDGIYTGVGCTCSGSSCTCLDWEFSQCTDPGT